MLFSPTTHTFSACEARMIRPSPEDATGSFITRTNGVSLASRAKGIGDGPVFTFRSLPQEIIDRFGMYTNAHRNPQAFLWAGSDEDYEALAEAI